MKPIENYIECPFYIAERERQIICEGAVDNTVTEIKFESALAKRKYEKEFCCVKLGSECPYNKLLNKKYE